MSDQSHSGPCAHMCHECTQSQLHSEGHRAMMQAMRHANHKEGIWVHRRTGISIPSFHACVAMRAPCDVPLVRACASTRSLPHTHAKANAHGTPCAMHASSACHKGMDPSKLCICDVVRCAAASFSTLQCFVFVDFGCMSVLGV